MDSNRRESLKGIAAAPLMAESPQGAPLPFLGLLRSRQKPNCTVETAAAVAGPQMANLACRRKKRVAAA